jgi:hypothetical protein
MQDNITPQHIQISVNTNDPEDLLRQLIDKCLQRDKEIEACKKKVDEKSRALVIMKTSTQWFMHEVALLEREKSQYESSS